MTQPIPAEERRRSLFASFLRITLGLVAVVVLVAAVGAVVSALWLQRAMREQLPAIDGQQHIAGLSAPVTVRRDAHGIPTITAENVDDLLVAQGFVTAQDRLWEMDMARRMAAGDAAEILGQPLVEHDRLQRVLEMRTNAERLASTLTEQERRYLEDYARGVNTFIAQSPGRLPAEFRLLMYKPRPWQPVDTMLVAMTMVQMMDEHWSDKLNREAITQKIGSALADTLYPTGSWRDHPPVGATPDLTAPRQKIPEVPLDESQSLLQQRTEDLERLRTLVAENRCESCIAGSNEWAISGAHTASGKPLLANDMHLGHQIPNIWYETALKAGSFHVAGVTVPGIPFIVAGHNDRVAWGFTALYGDTQDLYVEPVGTPVEPTHDVIHVRGGKDIELTLAHTAHGPVITPLLPHESRTIALKWSAYDPSAQGLPLYQLDSAANWNDFREALRHWWGPTLNIVYADVNGHIGYQAVGYIPNRELGMTPVPVRDGAHEWQGFVPFDQMPATLDPASGILATANSRITPEGYPHPLSVEWADPYRNERIWKWLAGKDKLRREDMLTLQDDIYSEVDQEFAQRFAYAIDHAQHTTPRLRQAADLLRSWDGVLSVDSAAASIVEEAKASFWPMLLRPRLGEGWRLYTWAESGFAREELIMHTPAAWLPRQYGNWDDFLAAVVAEGLKQKDTPPDLRNWVYGSWHRVDLEHPLYGLLPWFRTWTGTGAQAQSGNGSTVKQVGRTFGPSQRFTMDWSAPDQSTENIVMGQSGDPLSPYYRDQWPYWYSGTSFPLPFSDDAVKAAAQHTLRLVP